MLHIGSHKNLSEMLLRLQTLWILSLILLYCGNGEASWLNPIKTAVIDRSMPDDGTPSYYHILPVDRTTFSVTRKVWLYQIDIARIFSLISNEKLPIDNVSVKVKITEKYLNDMKDKAVVFVGNVVLNSTSEAKIDFSPEIMLTPKHMYEIRFLMPAQNFIYDEHLSVKDQKIKRKLWSAIRTSFYRTNIADKPSAGGSEEKISYGIVKRIYIKYKRF